ncbi:MAG: polysaccharide deacetylase family protein [Prevotellaceae bacterium]|jgi:hypothetical protein|nr:polysaccharide deacetylase family protein [Prevotellaceae bacterium]
MNEIVQYIFNFLTDFHFSERNGNLFAYTSNHNDFGKYKIIIKKSDFFDNNIFLTQKSLPALPLTTWEGVPLLFGEPTVDRQGDTMALNADIIASSFFLLTRYEELINASRDEHGRFAAQNSLPFRAGFLHRPVVDEYGRALRNLLRNNGIKMPAEKPFGIEKIYLTHDVDCLAHYRNFRSLAGAILRRRNIKMAFETFFGKIENDEWYTFPFLFEKDSSLNFDNIEKTVFILKEYAPKNPLKTTFRRKREEYFAETGTDKDKSNFQFRTNDFQKFIALCQINDVKTGLHASYAAGENPALIAAEKLALERATGHAITCNRNHYLRSKEPRDFRKLIEAGISQDFTMTYAQCAGFRLGTAHNVRWIDAENLEVTPLTLHPLAVMDNSLSAEKYMNLSENDAFNYAKQLIDATAKFNGELSLLWHNTSVSENYHRNLYSKIISYLKKLSIGSSQVSED